MKPCRPWADVIADWSPELAAKLHRSVEQILAKGLSARDFCGGKAVEIRYPNGWVMRCGFAFAVVRPGARQAAVFSEHGGYVEFDLGEETVVVEMNEDIVYRQD